MWSRNREGAFGARRYRTLYWGIAQAGSYTTWQTYHTYKMLRETSDPATVEQVRGYIDELKKMRADESLIN